MPFAKSDHEEVATGHDAALSALPKVKVGKVPQGKGGRKNVASENFSSGEFPRADLSHFHSSAVINRRI